MKDTWIILAAYNEEKNIEQVLEKLAPYDVEVVVVDDGSKDSTVRLAERFTPFVLRHRINLGKGAAVKTGCDFAVGKGANNLILMDSDGQHEAKEIPKFIELLKNHDIIFGARKFDKNMPRTLRFGNWFFHKMVKLFFGVDIKDTQGGFRAMNAKTYKIVRWETSGYAMETEMIANMRGQGLLYTEIPIETIYLDKYKGTSPLDGIKIFIDMVLWRIKK